MYSFHYLITLDFCHLHLTTYCLSDPLKGSSATFLSRSVLASLFEWLLWYSLTERDWEIKGRLMFHGNSFQRFQDGFDC